MCFRVDIHSSRTAIENRFGRLFKDGENFEPQYLFSAFDYPKLPVICQENSNTISCMHWGLIPNHINNTETAFEIRKNTLNARFETIHTKKSFQGPIKTKRCLVVANGFFEWQQKGKIKSPYYITLNNGMPFAFAGIYDRWETENSQQAYEGFSIITLAASPLMAEIHNTKKRMPFILRPEQEEFWINGALNPMHIDQTFLQVSDNDLVAWEVNPEVFKSTNKHNDVQTISKIIKTEMPRQLHLF
jgi:putative SOS response-associated peptidase YedK